MLIVLERYMPGVQRALEWIEEKTGEVREEDMLLLEAALPDEDLSEWNKELEYALAHCLSGKAARIAMNTATRPSVSGYLTWQRLTRDARGKLGAQTSILAEKVLHPVQVRNLEDISAGIEEWEGLCTRFEQVGSLSEASKAVALNIILPDEILRDLNRLPPMGYE